MGLVKWAKVIMNHSTSKGQPQMIYVVFLQGMIRTELNLFL
jgi:hypothetical protein